MNATPLMIAGHPLRTVEEWAKIMRVHPNLIWKRLREGWSSHEAVFRPRRAVIKRWIRMQAAHRKARS